MYEEYSLNNNLLFVALSFFLWGYSTLCMQGFFFFSKTEVFIKKNSKEPKHFIFGTEIMVRFRCRCINNFVSGKTSQGLCVCISWFLCTATDCLSPSVTDGIPVTFLWGCPCQLRRLAPVYITYCYPFSPTTKEYMKPKAQSPIAQ